MEKRKINGFLVSNMAIREVAFDDTLENIYSLVQCEVVDMPIRYIGANAYTFIVDDEAWLNAKLPLMSGICDDAKEVLLGNILIVGLPDGEGNLTAFSENELCAVGEDVYNAFHGGVLHYTSQKPKKAR